jgi:V8-like Glu-specific endopeptidase
LSSSTKVYPESAIVEITDVIGGVAYQGSGVLIAPDEVLTATHMVYQSDVGTATDIEVSPGYSSGATPYGTVAAANFHYNALNDSNGEISNSASQSDFAVIHLAQPVTNAGTMALGDNFAGGAATVSGYPATASGAQVDQAETVSDDPYYTLLTGTALGAGSSGGPVWITGADGQPQVVGLVSSGSGKLGYFVQLTSADVSEIMAWVAADDGTTVQSTTVTDTIPGPGGTTVSLNFPSATAALAQQALNQMAAGATTLFISQAQTLAVSASYSAVVDNATGGTTLSLAAGATVSVVASGGPLVLAAGGASGALVGGADGTFFSQTGGAWNVALGGGANTIVSAGGNSTVAAGAGQNLIMLGSGAASVASTGADTIIGGAVAATISASTNQALLFGGVGTMTFLAGGSSSTLIGAAGGTTVQGGSGATLLFGTGATSYQGGGAADTVLGGAGSLTAQGGGGAVMLFGGASGDNSLVSGGGDATLVGAAAGDVLRATGTASVVLVAGAGAETLSGAGASGNALFFGGSGADVMTCGSGNDMLVAGSGNTTLSGGGGTDAFMFIAGVGAGSDVITDFSAQRDFLYLEGFNPTALAQAEHAQTISATGTQLTLPDGLQIFFSGVYGLSQSSFR